MRKAKSGLFTELLTKVSPGPIFANRGQLVHEARKNLDGLLAKVLNSARHNRHELLAFLNIPTRRDLARLQRKVHQLEVRLQSLGKPGHSPAPHV